MHWRFKEAQVKSDNMKYRVIKVLLYSRNKTHTIRSAVPYISNTH
jgi:hypothetical protein